MSAALSRLAALHGIALDYGDIWGNVHAVPAATLRGLLVAMGVPAGTDAEIEAALHAQGAAQWRRALAPVVIVPHGAPPALRLNVPDGLDTATLHWHLTEEQGAERDGSFEPASLSCRERATIDGEDFVARELVLPVEPLPGYHHLTVSGGSAMVGETLLIVAPCTCYRPAALDHGGKVWGPTAQLYALRSERNWGIGDFTDLCTLLEQWAAHGAGIIGVSPLHALFPHNPRHASPYSSSSRLFLNVLYLDVEAIADLRECEVARGLLHAVG